MSGDAASEGRGAPPCWISALFAFTIARLVSRRVTRVKGWLAHSPAPALHINAIKLTTK